MKMSSDLKIKSDLLLTVKAEIFHYKIFEVFRPRKMKGIFKIPSCEHTHIQKFR
jgi:hypothetical protein